MGRRSWIGVVAICLLAFGLTACGGSFDRAASHPEQASYAEAAPTPRMTEAAMDADEGSGWEVVPQSSAPSGKTRGGAPSGGNPGVGQVGGTQPAPGEGPGETRADSPAEENAGPLLIYTAQVHLAVFETEQALGEAEKIMRDARGYLVQRTTRNITVRVPAEKFQGALAAVLDLGDVLHQDVKARDVTDEFHDVQTRLRTLEALRGRLEELLARADKVEDALAVERELGRIVTEIERLKGRLKLMRELVAFSTITVELRPRAEKTTISSDFYLPFPWLQSLGLGELLSL